MKDMPLVSVIIPLYNAQNYIEETIQSVINQTYQNWELLVIDDCSIDNSIEIVNKIKEKEKRITLILSELNFGGPAKPRNIGIDNAKGEYIAFLDADDVWCKDKLDYQINYMMQKNYNFTSTNVIAMDKYSNYLKKNSFYYFFNKFKNKNNACDLIKYSFIANSSVIVEKKIIEYFSEERDLVAVEDFYLWLELFSKREIKFKFLDKELLKYRVLEDSISDRNITVKQYIKADIVVLQHILKSYNYNLIYCFYKKIFKDMIKDIFKLS